MHTQKKSNDLEISTLRSWVNRRWRQPPILLKMTAPATLQRYAGSVVMHFVAGAVLSAVVGRGLRLANAIKY